MKLQLTARPAACRRGRGPSSRAERCRSPRSERSRRDETRRPRRRVVADGRRDEAGRPGQGEARGVEARRIEVARERRVTRSPEIPVAPGRRCLARDRRGRRRGRAVVNDQLTGAASATPSTALTGVVTVAVYVVEKARAAFGVSVAVRVESSYSRPSRARSAPPRPVNVNEDVVIVVGSSERENVAGDVPSG